MPRLHEREPSAAVVHTEELLLTSNVLGGGIGSVESVFSKVKLIDVVALFTVWVWRETLDDAALGILMENEAGARPPPAAGGAVVTGAAVPCVVGALAEPPPPPHAAKAATAASAANARNRLACNGLLSMILHLR